jgi:hypothetical protein
VQKLNKVARRLEKKQEAKEPIMFKNVFFTEAEYCTAGTGTRAKEVTLRLKNQRRNVNIIDTR